MDLAARHGVGVLAVTDHDTVAGLADALAAAERAGVRLVCGVELSVRIPAGAMHLLGYFPDPAPQPLTATVAQLAEARVTRAREIVARLAEMGVTIGWPDVAGRARGTVGRPHVAEALVAAGHARDRQDAFDRFLARDRPAYVPSRGLEPDEAIALVTGSGGTAVLAHPATLALEPGALDQRLRQLVGAGLGGIEVHRPDHSRGQRRQFQALAQRHGLIPLGGSDFHRPDGPVPPGDTGSPALPASSVERLLAGL